MSVAPATAQPLEALVEDYARQPVPAGAGIGLLRIMMIMIGGMIALPAFVMGAELGAGLGFGRMIAACVCGGAILSVVAIASAIAGQRSGLSTYLLISAAFGKYGGAIANGVIGLSLIGWFGVIMMMFGRSAAEVAERIALPGSTLGWASAGAVLMTITAIVGFKALDRLSIVLTPAKAILLVATVAAALHSYGASALATSADAVMPLGTGITLVVGGLVIGATVQPDIARFAFTWRSAALAAFSAFGIAFPLVLVLAGIPSLIMHERDIVVIMVTLGLGVPAMLTVVIAAWTNNTYNLYASSLALSTIVPRQPRWLLTVVVGIVGTALGLAGISDQLVPYLLVLSVVIPPIAGVYLANFYIAEARGDRIGEPASWHGAALIAWALGAGLAGAEAWRGFAIAGIPALDSLLFAALVYLPLRWPERG